jgi:hypothetical protein
VPDAGEPAATKKSPAYRIGATVLSVAVIVFIFLAVIPQFANYRDAWAAIAKMSLGWWVAIAAAAVIHLGAGVWGFQAALPRLRYRHGFMEMQASTAVATTVPAGGALALGLTYRMFGSFGFSNVAISTAVVPPACGTWGQVRAADRGRGPAGGHRTTNRRHGGRRPGRVAGHGGVRDRAVAGLPG